MFVLLSSGEGGRVGSTAVLCAVTLWRKTVGKISCGLMRHWPGLSGFIPCSGMCVGWILTEQDCIPWRGAGPGGSPGSWAVPGKKGSMLFCAVFLPKSSW